jgi:peptide/bleomycin uptake transporter
LFKSFFLSKKYFVWAWLGGIFLFALVLAQVYLTVLLNDWYRQFYDALQKAEDIALFWKLITNFAWLAFPYVFIAMFSFYVAQHFAFRWREAITFYYLPIWKNTSSAIEGASQRIQQDTYEFAKALESLGLGLFKAILTLISFIPILWGLSTKITIPFLADIEGSLVYVAFLTSIGGMIISYFVGIKLPSIEYHNQRLEAEYRKNLVYCEDDRKFASSETLFELFLGLKANYIRMFNHYSYFSLWSNLYQQTMIILPYLVMAPSLFSGVITLGFITQTGNAFGKVNDSFSYLIDRWTDITKFLSVLKRLKEFEAKIIKANLDENNS